MKKIITIMVLGLCVAMASCKKNDEDATLFATWKYDRVEITGVNDAEAKAFITDFLAGKYVIAAITMKFAADGTITLTQQTSGSNQNLVSTGTYTYDEKTNMLEFGEFDGGSGTETIKCTYSASELRLSQDATKDVNIKLAEAFAKGDISKEVVVTKAELVAVLKKVS